MTAIKKFFAANLIESNLFSHPSITASTQGLKNLHKFSNTKRKIRLTMTSAAMHIVGHTVQAQTGWSDWDILMAWSLFLICYFGSCRAGDLLSLRANTVTDKVLLWSDITFDQSGDRVVIYLRSPKTSVGNKGHSVVLSTNPEANLCPVRHLRKFRRVSRTQDPGSFSQTEIRAAGWWRSDAAQAFVWCQLQSANNLARKIYQLK